MPTTQNNSRRSVVNLNLLFFLFFSLVQNQRFTFQFHRRSTRKEGNARVVFFNRIPTLNECTAFFSRNTLTTLDGGHLVLVVFLVEFSEKDGIKWWERKGRLCIVVECINKQTRPRFRNGGRVICLDRKCRSYNPKKRARPAGLLGWHRLFFTAKALTLDYSSDEACQMEVYIG